MPRPLARRLSLAALLLLPIIAESGEILLYDGNQGNRPDDQLWLTAIGVGSVGVAPGGVAVNTMLLDLLVWPFGYFNYFLDATPDTWSLKNTAFPALDPEAGFTLGFKLRISDEDHVSDHRAGFSVILLGQDLLGIELGFWENGVWAQSGPSFTQDEHFAFDTTGVEFILYELTILGPKYFLSANGSDILTGLTRDYSSATPNPDPYGTPNMLFLGDNTTSAGARFTLGSILLRTGPFDLPALVPAPAPYALLLPAVAWLARRRTRLSACPTSGPCQPPRSLQARHHTRSGQGTQRGSDA
jgi:hypothetical protein